MLGRRPRRRELEPLTWCLGLVSRVLPAREYADSLRTLEHCGKLAGSFFTDVDVLLTPTLATPPPGLGTLPPHPAEQLQLRVLGAFGSGRIVRMAGLLDQMAEGAFDFTPWTPVFNISGQPAMSVPLHWNGDGLPVGVHLVARVGDEAHPPAPRRPARTGAPLVRPAARRGLLTQQAVYLWRRARRCSRRPQRRGSRCRSFAEQHCRQVRGRASPQARRGCTKGLPKIRSADQGGRGDRNHGNE